MTNEMYNKLLNIAESLREHYLGKEEGEYAVTAAKDILTLVSETADNTKVRLSALGHLAILHKNNYRLGHDTDGLKKAARLLKQCINESSSDRERSIYQIEVGGVLLDLDESDNAEVILKQAYGHALPQDKCHLLTKLAMVGSEKSDKTKAEQYLKEAEDNFEQAHPSHKISYWLVKAKLEKIKGNLSDAKSYAQKALSEAEKEQFSVRTEQARKLLASLEVVT